MKFTCNTKPLSDVMDLCVINSNVSKFYQKSCVVELNIEDNSLRINTEVSAIKSEANLKGKTSGDGFKHIFVDSMLFKNLINTIETDTIDLDIDENTLVVTSGKSKFNLPQMISGDELELDRPVKIEDTSKFNNIGVDGWKFIKDQQLYALAASLTLPVYTNLWVSENNDTIAGDVDNNIFTYSKKSEFNTQCLLTDTIINLLTTVPENSKMAQSGKNYVISLETDPYVYSCEFIPKYETDEGVGEYSASMILPLFENKTLSIQFNTEQISKGIAQAELFMSTLDDVITLKVTNDSLRIVNNNVDCETKITNKSNIEFELGFKISLFKDAINHMDSKDINMCPLIQDDELTGVIMWTDNMTTVLAGVED